MSIIKRIAAIILAAGLCLSSLALAENVPSFATIGEAMDSESYTGVTGGRLLQEMFRLEMSYGVRFMFCDKRSCGRRIMEILTTGQ